MSMLFIKYNWNMFNWQTLVGKWYGHKWPNTYKC